MTLHAEAIPQSAMVIQTAIPLAWSSPAGMLPPAVPWWHHPEYKDRRGEWQLAHSAKRGLPLDAGVVAAAVMEIAAFIDGGPVDPQPSDQDREESRMP